MKRLSIWYLPCVLLGVSACGESNSDQFLMSGSQDSREASSSLERREASRERPSESNEREQLTKWERVAGRAFRANIDDLERVVDAYPPAEDSVRESSPIYDPQEPDLCEDFYYQLCDDHFECREGYHCGQRSAECQPSACGCDPETGDQADCTRDCRLDMGVCVPGERPLVVVDTRNTKPSNGRPKSFTPDLTCEFQSANPNPMSYCEDGMANLSVIDANSADLPTACHYEIIVSSNVDGQVHDLWKWSGYDNFAFNHDVPLQHLSIGAHELCFDVIRVCDATYTDTDGTVYQNPFAGVTEQCSACLDPKFEVVLPDLNGEFCGMTEAEWHQEFMNGAHCIDERNSFAVFIDGTPGNDLIIGNSMPNIINGRAGDDCIYGNGGPDRIDGNFGNDYISGGPGADKLNGGWGIDFIRGDEGDDFIKGSLGDDVLEGNSGRDKIRGDSGGDTILGGEGADELKGEWGSDYIFGGAGPDEIYGGWGKDNLFGDDGDDKLKGGARADFIAGNNDRDFLMGDGGRDNLSGGQGGDRLCGNWGRDVLNGDSNTDRCNGGPGSDVEYNCEHTAHESACTERAFDEGLPELPNISGVFCGVDASVWLHEFQNGSVSIIDDRSGSNVNITGTSRRDLILGNSQDNRIRGNGGDDCIYGYDGDDDIDGELGDDVLYGGNGNDELKGGWGADRIAGEAGNDHIDGDAGTDILYGGPGNDFIKGGAHSDTMYGDAGNDTIRGDAGNDTIHGGSGNDTVYGEWGSDKLYGGSGNDALKGGLGDDILYGNDGRDKLKGGLGDDTIYGGSGHDLLMGDGNRDRLYGESGNDRLCGNSGADILVGGANSDQCRGGWGSDSVTQCEGNASYNQCTDSAWNGY